MQLPDCPTCISCVTLNKGLNFVFRVETLCQEVLGTFSVLLHVVARKLEAINYLASVIINCEMCQIQQETGSTRNIFKRTALSKISEWQHTVSFK